MRPCDACIEGRHVRCRPPCICSVCGNRLTIIEKPKDGPRPTLTREEEEIRDAVLQITEAVVAQVSTPRSGGHCDTCGQCL